MAITRLKLLPRTTVKAKCITRIAGQVTAGDGILVEQDGGSFQVSIDFENGAIVNNPAPLTDNYAVRGDGGASAIQTSALLIDDDGDLSVTYSLNAVHGITLTNSSTGSAATAQLTLNNSADVTSFGVASTGFIASLLTNRAFWYAGPSLAGIAIDADGSNPIIFATGNTERARIESAGLTLETDLAITEGGTGASTAQGALDNLGFGPSFISAANYATLQDAADALPSNGGVFFIPPGNYFENVDFGARSSLLIIGYGATLRMPAAQASGTASLKIGDGSTYTTGVTIIGLSIIGNKADQINPTYGIHVHGVEVPHIDNCSVAHCSSHGIYLQGVGLGAAVNYPTISHCYITTNDGNGIYAAGSTYGLYAHHNTISGNGNNPAGGAGVVCFANDTHLITNNVFDVNEHGCYINACSSVSIVSNAFINQDRNAVLIVSSDHCTINDNNIQSPSMELADSYHGILTDGTYGDYIGNSIWGRALRMGGGVTETGAANYNTIAHNQVHNAVTGVTITGANSAQMNNKLDGVVTALAVKFGGSGAVTLTGLLQGNGTSAFTVISDSSTTGQVLRVTGASTYAWGALNLASANAITGDLPFANLTQGSALSVLGVTGNATADVASIAAGTDNQVLRRSGTAVAFGAVNLASSDAVTGTLAVGNGGTGITSLGTGVATWLGTPSSANLRSAITDETGTGALVFADGNIGNAIAASLKPASDSTTAFRVFKSDGSTRVVCVDTTNARVGINTTPSVTFEVIAADGAVTFRSGTGGSNMLVNFIDGSNTNNWAFLAGASGAGGIYDGTSGNIAVEIAPTTDNVKMPGNLTVKSATATPAGGTAGAGLCFGTTSNFGIFYGSGAPSLSAAKGSLYLRSDGSGTTDRAYINTNGSTTWTALTTAA